MEIGPYDQVLEMAGIAFRTLHHQEPSSPAMFVTCLDEKCPRQDSPTCTAAVQNFFWYTQG